MISSNKKRFISIVSLVVLLINFISVPTSIHAASGPDIILNGNRLNLDVRPIALDNRTYVPVRAILEELGMNVTWDQASQTVIGKKEGSVIKLPLKYDWSSGGTYNGVQFHNEHAPNIARNGRTLVPVRSIATVIGLDVKWDNFTNNVILTDYNKHNVSLKQAHDILKNKFNSSHDYMGEEYELFPLGGYASQDNYALDNYYIFAVHTPFMDTDEYGNAVKDYTTWDSNYCVNKHTGEIKVYAPEIGFNNNYLDMEY